MNIFVGSKRSKFSFVFSKWKVPVPVIWCNGVLSVSSKKSDLLEKIKYKSVVSNLTCCSLMTNLRNKNFELALYGLLWPCKNQKRRKNKMGWSDCRLVCILMNLYMSLPPFHHAVVFLVNIKCTTYWQLSWILNLISE